MARRTNADDYITSAQGGGNCLQGNMHLTASIRSFRKQLKAYNFTKLSRLKYSYGVQCFYACYFAKPDNELIYHVKVPGTNGIPYK